MTRRSFAGYLSLIVAFPLLGAPPASRNRDKEPEATSEPVQQALEKELRGDNVARQSLLRQQVAVNPDDAAAHWHLGEIRVNGRWLPYDRLVDEGDYWRQLYRYAEQRSKRKNTVDDQLYLADGARSHGLFDQERAHLMQVVALDPTHVEAHQRLGDVYADGAWIRRETFERTVHSQHRWQESLARHRKEAEQFAARMRRSSSLPREKIQERWNAWGDPERLPALEQAVGDRGDALQSEYISWLSRLSCYEASRAIARQALFSEHETVRLQATEELKGRPWEDYMRELVASVVIARDGAEPVFDRRSNAHVASFSWETMDNIVETQWTLRHPITAMSVPVLFPRPRTGGIDAVSVSRVDRGEASGRAASEMWHTFQHLRATEDGTRNERALRAIGRIAGKSFKSARELWDWWERVDDVVQAQERISRNYVDNWYVDTGRRRIQTSPWPVVQLLVAAVQSSPSCLAAGTPVVTETGARPIESIEIGDRLLAQDIETGELVFKPVVARTTREKAKLYRLKTASDEIVCSQGHPFWVNTIGWVRARSLKPGMPLHTTSGAKEVVSIEPAGEGTVYNVVAADVHTYFVGKSQAFLSHDVTPRQPTNALAPGLQPLWTVPDEADKPVALKE